MRHLTQLSRKEITALFKRSKIIKNYPEFSARCAPKTNENGRLLLVVSHKVGNAPTRNKLRRQLKAIFYEEHLYAQGYDWIITVRPAITSLSFQELRARMLELCSAAC
jgi:ribonuclease P protein component